MIIDLPQETAAAVPPGNYTLRFVGGNMMPANLEKGYKPAIRFQFEVLAGEHAGKKVSRSCGVSGGPKATLPAFLTGLMGKQPTPGPIDLAPLVGRQYLGLVAQSPQGKGVRVETVILQQ